MDLQILHMYQDLRECFGSVLTPIFQTISNLGASTPAIFVCSIIYWCISKKLGQKIMMAVFGGGVINQALKNTFCVYRPWIRDTTIIPAEDVSGYSFPSGHSQMGAGIYGNIYLTCRKNKKLLAVIAAILVFLVPISRNYLGVHTPQDILVGTIEGLFCIYLFNKILKKVDEHKNGDIIFFAASVLLTVIFLIYTSIKAYPMDYTQTGELLVDPFVMTRDCYGVAGMFLGMLAGWIIERRFVKFDMNVSIAAKIARAIFGFAGFIAVSKGMAFLGEVHLWYGTLAACFCMFFFIAGVWPLIFSSVDKWRQKSKNSD